MSELRCEWPLRASDGDDTPDHFEGNLAANIAGGRFPACELPPVAQIGLPSARAIFVCQKHFDEWRTT